MFWDTCNSKLLCKLTKGLVVGSTWGWRGTMALPDPTARLSVAVRCCRAPSGLGLALASAANGWTSWSSATDIAPLSFWSASLRGHLTRSCQLLFWPFETFSIARMKYKYTMKLDLCLKLLNKETILSNSKLDQTTDSYQIKQLINCCVEFTILTTTDWWRHTRSKWRHSHNVDLQGLRKVQYHSCNNLSIHRRETAIRRNREWNEL